MSLLDGIHEWSGAELKAKDKAVENHGQIFADDEGVFDLAETSYETAALNQILAWLDFPYQQRAYLDCLIAIAGGSEKARFAATNIEIARQLRTGKNSRDESLAKWVTRQKKKFQEWQARRQFNLVEITDGWFDAKKQRNTPASYVLHIVEWAKRAVANAKMKYKKSWSKGIEHRRVQLRAIRRAVYDLLQSLPECPPLRLKDRTLSVEENFDRRAHSIITFAEKNVSDLHRSGHDHAEFLDYVIGELQKLKMKPPGALGNLLTPAEKDPDKKAKIWQAIQRGKLSELISPSGGIEYTDAGADESFTAAEDVSKPEDSTVETDSHRTDIESDNCTFEAGSVCKALSPLSVGRTFLSEDDQPEESPGTTENVIADDGETTSDRTDTSPAEQSDDCELSTATDRNPLNPLNAGRTFLSGDRSLSNNPNQSIEPAPEESKSDDPEEETVLKKVQRTVGIWQAQINDRVPYPDRTQKNEGAWEIAWQTFGSDAARTENALNFAILKTAYDRISLEKLKPVFVDYVMARVRWWKHNVPVICEAAPLMKFRARLFDFLETPDL